MTNRTITSVAMLACGMTLLIVGATIQHDMLFGIGSSVMFTALAYAAGKAYASYKDKQ